jgi:lambda repressor-like predicted transcriptional regulator
MNAKALLKRLKHEADPVKRGQLIYMELRLSGIRYMDIARELGKTLNGVKHAIMDSSKSERIQTHVAGLLGVDKSELWPRRYRDNG